MLPPDPKAPKEGTSDDQGNPSNSNEVDSKDKVKRHKDADEDLDEAEEAERAKVDAAEMFANMFETAVGMAAEATERRYLPQDDVASDGSEKHGGGDEEV